MSPYTERVLLAARALKTAKAQFIEAKSAVLTYGPSGERNQAFFEAEEAAVDALHELCVAACAD